MSRVRATFRRGKWVVDVLDPTTIPRSLEARFSEDRRVLNYPADPRKVWRLEFEKSETAASPADREHADSFVAGCISDPEKTHETEAWCGPVFRRAAILGLRAKGQPTAGASGLCYLRLLRLATASLVASVTLLASAARASLEQSDSLPEASPWIALFGDDATRDRLALGALAAVTGDNALPVLLIGRPRASIRAVRRRLRALADREYLICRPLDIPSLVSATPRIIAAMWHGAGELAASAAHPPIQELSAIAYRVFAGHVAAAWQRRHPRPSDVIYSQTGVADVTLLELEQQRAGATTTHLVHGVSLGKNFIGFSDVAIFQCLHDALWHENMGGYGRCTYQPMDVPQFIAGGDGWLLLSNLVHSMNPEYRLRGAAPELELLDAVAACARSAGIPASEVTWKPHPSFASQPAAIRSEVTAHVEALGFRYWPEGAEPTHAAGFRVILSTRSTVLLDLLRMGKLGILVDLSAPRADLTAVNLMPLVARDLEQLRWCVHATSHEASFGAAYLKAWQVIGPGRTDMTLDRILQISREARR